MTDRDELERAVRGGYATDEQLEEFFGADLINQGVYQLRGHDASVRAFAKWFEEVIEPMGLERDPAWRMYTGQDTIETYVDSLTPEQAERFENEFPALQEAFMERHASELR